MDVSAFRRLFRNAFGDRLPPEPEKIVSVVDGDIETRREILEAFRGRRWQDLDTDFMVAHDDAISFMEPQGMHYYLPAYLQAALEAPPLDYLPGMIVCELFLPLRKDPSDPIRQKFEAFLLLLSVTERDAIKRFLLHMAEKSPAWAIRRDAALALRFFWRRGVRFCISKS